MVQPHAVVQVGGGFRGAGADGGDDSDDEIGLDLHLALAPANARNFPAGVNSK